MGKVGEQATAVPPTGYLGKLTTYLGTYFSFTSRFLKAKNGGIDLRSWLA